MSTITSRARQNTFHTGRGARERNVKFGIMGGAMELGIIQGWSTKFVHGTPSFSWTREAASTPGFATSAVSGVTSFESKSY